MDGIQGFDMFGNPVRERTGLPGRPKYQPTDEERNKISRLLGLGWGNERIAKATDIRLSTLKRHFRTALAARDEMRDRLDAWRFNKACELAEAGNVAALKEVGKMIERNDLAVSDRRLRDAQERSPGLAPKAAGHLGKKERAKLAAESAGQDSVWGDDLLTPGLAH